MIAIVKYNAGNIFSLQCALRRLGYEGVVTDDEKVLRKADRVIFPGVGEASSSMAYLKQRELGKVLTSLTRPFLGICLGLQLMGNYSEENNTPCLGIFNSNIRLFKEKEVKIIPHMGWNNLILTKESHLFKGLENKENYVYFVHSYYMEVNTSTVACCKYENLTFSAALEKDNFYGLQFHPEKSGKTGEKILQNFLSEEL